MPLREGISVVETKPLSDLGAWKATFDAFGRFGSRSGLARRDDAAGRMSSVEGLAHGSERFGAKQSKMEDFHEFSLSRERF